MLELREQTLRRWRPYSRLIDPSSVARHPDDPRRWMEKTCDAAISVEQEGDSGGFSKIILLIDCSGSTADLYGGRMILNYIKDAAYGLLAYAREMNLPVTSIAFSTSAWLLAKESRSYVEHGKKIFMLRPMGGTNLHAAVSLAARAKPEKALITLITDGLVHPQHLEEFAERLRANRVVAAVVDANSEGVRAIESANPSIQAFIVKPDRAGRTIVEALPRKRREEAGSQA